MRFYGPRGQYFEMHISPDSRKEDCWVCLDFEIKNDLYEWKTNEEITINELIGTIELFRKNATRTDVKVNSIVDEQFKNNLEEVLNTYRDAISVGNFIKDYYVPRDFAFADKMFYMEPYLKIIIISKENGKNRYLVFFENNCPYSGGYFKECFVEFYATDEELLQFAYELECEMTDIPILDNY